MASDKKKDPKKRLIICVQTQVNLLTCEKMRLFSFDCICFINKIQDKVIYRWRRKKNED